MPFGFDQADDMTIFLFRFLYNLKRNGIRIQGADRYGIACGTGFEYTHSSVQQSGLFHDIGMDQIAFVFQNSRLFKASILENVRAAKPNASREEVLAALTAAQCGDILEKLPQGMDTMIGTEGTYLSGGEQQRIALARAILKDAPIVVLDEATASFFYTQLCA